MITVVSVGVGVACLIGEGVLEGWIRGDTGEEIVSSVLTQDVSKRMTVTIRVRSKCGKYLQDFMGILPNVYFREAGRTSGESGLNTPLHGTRPPITVEKQTKSGVLVKLDG